MAEVLGRIGKFLKQAATPKSALQLRARPIGEHATEKTISVTAVHQDPGSERWIFGPELPASLESVLRRLPDAAMTPFHRMEVTLSHATASDVVGRMNPGEAPSLVMAEMPLENARVFTAPFQSALTGNQATQPADATGDLALFDPLGHAVETVALSANRDVLLAIHSLCVGPDDLFLDEAGRLRASLPLALLEASIWPAGYVHSRPLAQMYERAMAANSQRFAVVFASHADLLTVHREIAASLADKCAFWLEEARRQSRDETLVSEQFVLEQAGISAWQALAGTDAKRGFAGGSEVAGLAKVYLNHSIGAWLQLQLHDPKRLGPDRSEPQSPQVGREILRVLGAITDPPDERSMLLAIRHAVENETVFLPAPEAEKLLDQVMRRLHEL